MRGMSRRRGGALLLALFLFSLALLIPGANATWHGGKALVLYRVPADGWVQYNYKDSHFWSKFRTEIENQGWDVDYGRHVNASLLSRYDALFVLTPVKDIPDEEAQAIIEWVKKGGQIVITQNYTQNFANEITDEFGIHFNGHGGKHVYIDNFTSHPLTDGITRVHLVETHKIYVGGMSEGIAWNRKGECLIAVNDSAGKGLVVAIGDNELWLNQRRLRQQEIP